MATENKRYTFYRKTSMGIATWTIWFSGDVIYYEHCMVEGGSPQIHQEKVELNQSGRNLQQQIDLQMQSRLSRMLDKGYKPTREQALEGATNQLGLPLPMKAHPIQKVSLPAFSVAYVQRKYNGHRCMITRQDGKLIAYSIKGKIIETVHHITQFLEHTVPEGVVLDGELYAHGMTLQKISSLIKRDQIESRKLCYHVYDVMEDMVYGERFEYMRKLIPVGRPEVSIVPTYKISELGQAYELTDQFRREGYEGGMLRLDLRGYEGALKRSNQILKIKKWLDADFEVVGAKPAKNGEAIFILKVKDGLTFDCLAPGPVSQKQQMMRDYLQYMGRMLTVRYAELTEDGKPFHGVAVQFVEHI